MSGILKRLTYRPKLVAVARLLRISGFLKNVYYRLAATQTGIYAAQLGALEAQFYASTAGEWRRMEGTYTGGQEMFMHLLLSSLHPGEVFYDVGSNIGEYAVFASKVVGDQGRVVAFEPERANYECILAHVSLNKLSNVRPLNIALGKESGEMFLQVGGFQNTQCRIVGSAPTGAQTQAVKVWRGDEMREAERLHFPNAVKIDVEGYEYHVVQGLKETLSHRSCRLLCCEVHPSRLPVGVRLEQVIEAIEACGFSRIEKFERGTEVHLVCTKQERNDGPP